MATLNEITDRMREFNSTVAPGSECAAWQDFIEDCYQALGCAPWDDDRQNDTVPEDFCAYWADCADGIGTDHDPETGDRY